MQELLYTSVPRGLKPGSRGFCTVLSTQGMVAPLAVALEGLSGYRPVFPVGHARVAENPVVYSHLKLQVAGKAWSVLSRIADYGLDYSQRTNKLAHHLVLDKSELPAAGPASLLRASGIMRESWEGEPKIGAAKPISKQPSVPSGVCQAWKDMTGDAGWAGVLAESFLKDPNRPVILLFEPGQDLRPLIDESLSLLPAERRWDVTFSTYFTGSSQGITCLWRGIVLGSKEATESLRFVNALRIELTSTDIGRAKGGDLVEAARKGVRLTARPTSPPKQSASREQQQQRVVVMDDADEPIEFRAFDEPAETRTHAALVVNHDHSQAPPRLTRSAFKFANAGSQKDADNPNARTSRAKRFFIPLLIVLLLGGSAAAIVAFNRHRPKSQALATSQSAGAPTSEMETQQGRGENEIGEQSQTSVSSEELRLKAEQDRKAKEAAIALKDKEAEDENARKMAKEKKAEEDALAAKVKAKEEAAKKVAAEEAKKKDEEATLVENAKADVGRLIELFEGVSPKLKLKNARKTVDNIPSAELLYWLPVKRSVVDLALESRLRFGSRCRL